MNNRVAAVTALVAMLLVGLGMYAFKREVSEPGADRADLAGSHALAASDAGEAGALTPPASRLPSGPSNVPVGVILSGDTRTVALSAEERVWLENHQFLSQEDIDAARSIPDEVLQAARTDPRAQTLWGLRLLERGEIIPAATILANAASHGSIYGYEQAAVALLKQSMEASNGVSYTDAANQFRARMEVAKILGDHRADALFATYFPDYDSQGGARTVQVQTTEFLRQLGANAQLQGTATAGPDPRPNAQLWADLQQLQQAGNASELIPVY